MRKKRNKNLVLLLAILTFIVVMTLLFSIEGIFIDFIESI